MKNTPSESVPKSVDNQQTNQAAAKPREFPIGLLIFVIMLIIIIKNPVYPTTPLHMKNKGIGKNGQQIHAALVAFAHSHDKVFPSKSLNEEPPQYSNDVLRNLFVVDLADDEALFYVRGHSAHAEQKPDQVIGTAENGYREALAAGENAWAYFPGLTLDRHPASTPLLRTVVSDRYDVTITVDGSVKIDDRKKAVPIPTELGWLLPAPAKGK